MLDQVSALLASLALFHSPKQALRTLLTFINNQWAIHTSSLTYLYLTEKGGICEAELSS